MGKRLGKSGEKKREAADDNGASRSFFVPPCGDSVSKKSRFNKNRVARCLTGCAAETVCYGLRAGLNVMEGCRDCSRSSSPASDCWALNSCCMTSAAARSRFRRAWAYSRRVVSASL